MKNFYKEKKILITGHTGFQGAWLALIMMSMGAEVVGISLPPHTVPNLFDIFGLRKKIRNYFVDIRDRKTLLEIVKSERPDIIFHLAAQAIVLDGYDDPVETYTTNVIGTANVLETVRLVKTIKSVVVVTTDKVYENKETGEAYKEDDKLNGYDPYSASKAAADIVAQSYIHSFFNSKFYNDKHNTLIGIARSGNVIGGGDWGNYRLIPDMIRAVYHNQEEIMTIRHPQSVRPWQHVFEPLLGYMILGKSLYEGRVDLVGAWNFGPSEKNCVPVEDVIRRFVALLGKGSYQVKTNIDKHEAGLLRLDNSKAGLQLGWKPKFSLDECLSLTSTWYKLYYKDVNKILDLSYKQISFLNS